MNPRLVLEAVTKVMEMSPLPKWLKWLVLIVGTALWFWPLMEMLNMIEITNLILLECAIALILGSFLSPMIFWKKAIAIGNSVTKSDFGCLLIGMLGGAFVGYLAFALYGDAFYVALGELSYMFVTLLASLVGSAVVAVIALKLSGSDWGTKMLDVDGDGDFDMDDIKALIGKVKKSANEAVDIATDKDKKL